MAGYSAYLAYAEQAGFTPRESRYMGLSNPAAAGLRCFRRYSKDATVDITDPWGKERWLSPKQARIYAILDRASSSTNRLTMHDIASEAMVCTSTVSRTVQKLQAFGLFAIDVIRGRHGGIVVRKRHIGDHLRRYAECAWAKIKSRLNVASTLTKRGGERVATTTTPMVATFNGANCDGRCTNLLDCSQFDRTPLAPSGASRDADLLQVRAQEFARAVIAERRRLDAEEPDWDIYLENVRSSYGLG